MLLEHYYEILHSVYNYYRDIVCELHAEDITKEQNGNSPAEVIKNS